MRRTAIITSVIVLAFSTAASGSVFAEEIDVKVGVLNDRSGVYSDAAGQGSVVAAQMAVEDFAAVDGSIRVTVIAADHQNKPDIGANIARQWYDQDGSRRDP